MVEVKVLAVFLLLIGIALGQTITPTVSNSSSITPTVSNSSSITPTISFSPSISNSSTTTPSLSNTPSVSETRSATPSISESTSISNSPSSSQTPSNSRIIPSDSPTPPSTPTASISAFSSPSASISIPFPSYLPLFVQPGGASTGEVILQLRVTANSFGDGIAAEVQATIASLMSIPPEAVIVVRITAFEQATVIICTGDIDGFFNSLNERSEIFDETILDNAYSEFIFWGVPCADPLDKDNLPVYSNPPSVDDTYSVGFDFSTFRFPNYGGSTESPESPSTDSDQISTGGVIINLDDDDDGDVIINVNDSGALHPFFMLSVLVLSLIALSFF